MTGAATHRLDGLEPDNLLAWLALLGALRSLDEARPGWRTRARWTVDEPPLRPCLELATAVTRDALLDALTQGIDLLAAPQAFDAVEVRIGAGPATRAQLAAAAADPRRAGVWAAIGSDAALSHDGDTLEPSPLCFMFGQGRQYFLKRLEEVPRLGDVPRRHRRRDEPELVSPRESLAEALFSPWRRRDDSPGFRWDHHEDVRHASRARDPTDDAGKGGRQTGANRLAAIAFPLLAVAPRVRWSRVRLGVVSGTEERDGTWRFRWPVWRQAARLSGLLAVLASPEHALRGRDPGLRIVEWYTAARIQNQQYRNVMRARGAHPRPAAEGER